MSGIICSECGRDIDEIGQDNMSCTSEPLCEDCWKEEQGHTVESLRREVRNLRFENCRLREKLDAMAEETAAPKAGKMEIKTVCEADMLPVRAHEHDAGADLRASEYHSIGSGQFATVPTGVRVSIPEGCFGLLAARSSLCKRGLLMANGVGIIDAGFTGEIKVPLFNAGNTPSNVLAGERIAQLVVIPCELPTFKMVDELGDTERGEGGFGSTGVA